MTNASLEAALQFSPDDLAHNRAATLSPRQRERLQARATRTLWLGGGLFFGMTLLATGAFYLGQQNESLILFFMGVFLTICNALLLGFSARQWLRLTADLRDPAPVQSTAGELVRVIRPYGRVSNYVLRVSDKQFSVEKEVFKTLTHEALYQLYYTAHTNALLAAERLKTLQD